MNQAQMKEFLAHIEHHCFEESFVKEGVTIFGTSWMLKDEGSDWAIEKLVAPVVDEGTLPKLREIRRIIQRSLYTHFDPNSLRRAKGGMTVGDDPVNAVAKDVLAALAAPEQEGASDGPM